MAGLVRRAEYIEALKELDEAREEVGIFKRAQRQIYQNS
jgi:hypothetical protein